MIFNYFKKIINTISLNKFSPLQKPDENWIKYGNKVKARTLNSRSEILARSRELKQGAVYSEVMIPKYENINSNNSDVHFTKSLDEALYFRDYDYLKKFEHNNSLRHGGIPLCVSPSQIGIIKKTDAVYCEEEKCWYSPYKSDANINDLYQFMPQVYDLSRENILHPNLVPEPLWGENLRKYLSKKDWNFLRKFIYSQSGYRCSICGGKGEEWPVECDEEWDYQSLNDQLGAAILIGLRALCPRCHQVNHLGKANVDSKYNETIRHMAYINGWSLNRSEHTAQDAFKLFNERSEKTWLLGYDNECSWDPSVEKILKKFFCEVSNPYADAK